MPNETNISFESFNFFCVCAELLDFCLSQLHCRHQQLNCTTQHASADILFYFHLYMELFNSLATNNHFKAKVEPTKASLFHLGVKRALTKLSHQT